MMAEASDDPNGERLRSTGGSLQPDFDQELRSRLGRGLKSEYGRALLEPLPPKLMQLLAILERLAAEQARAAEDRARDEPDASQKQR